MAPFWQLTRAGPPRGALNEIWPRVKCAALTRQVGPTEVFGENEKDVRSVGISRVKRGKRYGRQGADEREERFMAISCSG